MSESQFPPGTPVCVRQTIQRRDGPVEAQVVGVVEAWEEQPTGSWYAHGKKGRPLTSDARRASASDAKGKLWLTRLRLRKVDGEITLLVIDDSTSIARLEAKTISD